MSLATVLTHLDDARDALASALTEKGLTVSESITINGCAEKIGDLPEVGAVDTSDADAVAGDILSDRSLRRSLGGGFALVLANIVSDVIIPLSAFAGDFLAPDGVFVCSGIIEGREDEVAAALRANGFSVDEHRCEEEWHCFVCRRA